MIRVAVAVVLLLACGARAHASEQVVLENVKTEWRNLYGAIVYAASAIVHNTGATPVRAVQVRLSLFDKNGRLVLQRDGYNLAAEVLQDSPDARDAVRPIPPRGTDPVRLSVDKADIGQPFRRATLTVSHVE
jgi:hypothetical protein